MEATLCLVPGAAVTCWILFQQALLTYSPLTNVFPLFSNHLQKNNEAKFSYLSFQWRIPALTFYNAPSSFSQNLFYPNKVVHLPEFFIGMIKYSKL